MLEVKGKISNILLQLENKEQMYKQQITDLQLEKEQIHDNYQKEIYKLNYQHKTEIETWEMRNIQLESKCNRNDNFIQELTQTNHNLVVDIKNLTNHLEVRYLI